MRTLWIVLTLFAAACSHKKVDEGPRGPTYNQCVEEQEKVRKARFSEMPEGLRALSGKHTVVKYFDQRPKNLEAIVAQLKKENATYNARAQNKESTLDARLFDETPGRNQVLIAFEKRQNFLFAKVDDDKLLLKFDYSKPVLSYVIPVSALKEKDGAFSGRYSSVATAKTPTSYKGEKIQRRFDTAVRLRAVGSEHIYVEWVNHSYDPSLESEDWKSFFAVLKIKDEDRYFDTDAPYFDVLGELNPEACAPLVD